MIEFCYSDRLTLLNPKFLMKIGLVVLDFLSSFKNRRTCESTFKNIWKLFLLVIFDSKEF